MPGAGISILITNILGLALVFVGIPMAVLWVGSRVVRRASRDASSEAEVERLSRRVWELERRLADAERGEHAERGERASVGEGGA